MARFGMLAPVAPATNATERGGCVCWSGDPAAGLSHRAHELPTHFRHVLLILPLDFLNFCTLSMVSSNSLIDPKPPLPIASSTTRSHHTSTCSTARSAGCGNSSSHRCAKSTTNASNTSLSLGSFCIVRKKMPASSKSPSKICSSVGSVLVHAIRTTASRKSSKQSWMILAFFVMSFTRMRLHTNVSATSRVVKSVSISLKSRQKHFHSS
mmetsp:Transcript_27509/g.68009  ORF Transcript_27509/g.68009 Transcript_27509/m.68009 type:complete len:210 (+) Transcript_27509:495-1124(+)